jgi:hypothetical protein
MALTTLAVEQLLLGVTLDQIISASVWPVIGLLVGAAASVVVAYLQRKPTELQLGTAAFDQLQQLSDIYRKDLVEARVQRAESIQVEQALRTELAATRQEVAELKLQLVTAQAQIKELSALVRQQAG